MIAPPPTPGTSTPIRRVLVANRGEIAVRVIRTLQRLGIEAVLAVSAADRDSLGARLATRALCIGPAPPGHSYLRVDALLAAALGSGCQAVHPGYGFLAERADFAAACERHGLIFIGPSAAQIARAGDKLEARRLAQAAGVPTTPGGAVASAADALQLAARIGYPVLLKAACGGGGRGLKLAATPAELRAQFELARAEAQAAFGDDRVYLERYLRRARHVEVQLLGDGERVLQLGERDCSVQRRYQKLIEEAPAPQLPDALRAQLHAAALRFARRIGYRSLGTAEFLVDVDLGEFYFLELNARIQVEHPVTELVTGLDLVAEQIRVAQGQPLALAQAAVELRGHAIECRINAEDPANGFRPSPGRIVDVHLPEHAGVRIDTHVEAGCAVPPHYDSLLAKVVAHGPTRADAIRRLQAALAELRVGGVATNLELQRRVLAAPAWRAGAVDTGFLARWLAAPADVAAAAA